ncbi:TMEM175 family protein [Arthrobacter sp. MPF02]|uniref:TMEM175 family protein n=1 Tax=Arthrobacter sp. MPF02 TaxID=3388492 RepID=UPI00398480AE
MDKSVPLERMVFFSDAVFAIALTLLALDLKLPLGIPPERLTMELVGAIPELLAFVLSFLIIARVWMSHHNDFFRIRDFNPQLAWLNMLLLFFIVMLPAPTAFLSDYGGNPSPWPSVLYAATISGVYLTLAGMWTYAWRKGLTDDTVDEFEHRRVFRARLTAPAVFLLSIPAAFVLGSNTPWLWFLIIPAALVTRRLSGRRAAVAE